MTKRLLVVGGSGFIGHHVLVAARRMNWEVTSISLNPPIPVRLVDDIEYHQLNLVDRVLIQDFLGDRDFDYVVNLGGYIDHKLYKNGGRSLIESHFIGLLNLVESLNRKELKKFVQIGSSDEYGNIPPPQSEAEREEPISPYSLAKVAGTHFLQMLHNTEGFPVVILRLFLTYGPGQDSQRFLPQIIKGCLADQEFPTSEGFQRRDFCFIGDTIDAIIAALTTDEACGRVLNVASGKPEQIRTMIETVQSIVGKGKPKFGVIPYRVGENMNLYADIREANKVLQWEPRVGIEEGLKKTIDWYSKNI